MPVFSNLQYSTSSVLAASSGTFRIFSWSALLNTSFTRSIFHSFDPVHNREATFLLTIAWDTVEITWLSLINHGCPGIWIFSPVPILHLTPSHNSCLASKILRQMKLGLWPSVELKKSECSKYLALYNLETKLSGFVKNLHPCLPSMAMLKSLEFLKPKSPAFLCLVILSQDIQLI